MPKPAAVVISGCGHKELNGTYFQDGRDLNDFPIYKRKLLRPNVQAVLRNTDGTWEVVSAPSESAAPRRRVYAQDEGATTPDQVEGLWFEVQDQEEEEHRASSSMKIHVAPGEPKRRHSVSGGCQLLDVQWLLAEQMGSLTSEDTGCEPPSSESGSSSSSKVKEVSIVLAFRGTASVQNMLTDVRISLQPLAEESKTGPFGVSEGPPACFDLEKKVVQRLSTVTRNPFSPSARSAAEPLHLETGSAASSGAGESGFLWQLLSRCCSKLCFPFLPSDFDDDEDLGLEALDNVRVHQGFAQAYAAIRTDVLAILKARLQHWRDKGVTAKVYATGHSLGGSIAHLFARGCRED
ncbi:unnamed protein product [Effrenium voratum]|uniref:Fungal lipase-type domain-containing protein n=1 Tax=Effrenium voratum TaxID=2562239 RepID=A0AA36ITX1_9DINO|nr:unnamed protein product [Effrenium voratum]